MSRSFCLFYDMKPHSSKIFRDIVTALGLYVQSQFISPPITPSLLTSLISAATPTSGAHGGGPGSSLGGGQASGASASAFVSANQNQSQSQPSFLFRGTCIPVLFTLKPGQTKSYYLEQLDKLEVPSVPDGYGLTTAYHCILETVRSLITLVTGAPCTLDMSVEQNVDSLSSADTKSQMAALQELDADTRALRESLLASSWCGLLAAMSVMLEASTDETVTETILRHMQQLTALYGVYGISAARDGFVIAMCRSSLPAGYNLASLTFKLPTNSGTSTPDNASLSVENSHHGADNNHSRSSSIDLSASSSANLLLLSTNATLLQQQLQTNNHSSYLSGNPTIEASGDLRQQVVAVGTALPTSQMAANASAVQGPVMLTAKNLQCMRAILTVAQCHGVTLHAAWHEILVTLQHLVWILGLKPSAGGSLKVTRPGTEAGASTTSALMITTAAISDLPMLTTMLSRLFESSQ